MATETKAIIGRLDRIQADLDFIKEHVKDIDVVLTDDDVQALNDAERDFERKRLKRL